MKLSKLRELGWTTEELKRDRQAFLDVFDAYVARYSSKDSNIETEDEGEEESNDELALDIDIVAESPLKTPLSLGSEAERYLAEPPLKKSNKQTYSESWKGATSFYPILAIMARDYGTIMASSVPSESVFSIAGLQITKRRNRLAPKTMGVILCLRSWGLLPDEVDDDDEDGEDEVGEDIRKDWGYGRADLDEIVLDSQT
jgi:hypothetical protein